MSISTPEAAGPSVTYLPDTRILVTDLPAPPTRPEVVHLLAEVARLVREHQCPRYLLNLLALPRPLARHSRRQLLSGLVEIGHRAIGLRVVLVSPRPGEAAEWLDGLPMTFGVWAIDLASFTTREPAQLWLHGSPRAHLYA